MPKPTPEQHVNQIVKEFVESPAFKAYAEAGRRVLDGWVEFCRRFNAEMERARRERLAEKGRRLASEREDRIAGGADPADLTIPLHPGDDDG